MILKLTPLVERIDRELAKDQDERVDFRVEVDNPSTLKNHLEDYKAALRQDWYQKFQMWHRKGTGFIQFRFNVRTNNSYTIVDIKPELEKKESYKIIEPVTTTPQDGVPLELDDLGVSGYILEMTPRIIVFRSSLSPETQAYLKDPINNPPSALINLATRMGYNVTSLIEKVRFVYGS